MTLILHKLHMYTCCDNELSQSLWALFYESLANQLHLILSINIVVDRPQWLRMQSCKGNAAIQDNGSGHDSSMTLQMHCQAIS